MRSLLYDEHESLVPVVRQPVGFAIAKRKQHAALANDMTDTTAL
jgi:hypothetical protein